MHSVVTLLSSKRDIVNNLFSNALSYKYNNKRVQNYQTDTCGDYFVCIIAITVAEEEPCKVFYQIFQ